MRVPQLNSLPDKIKFYHIFIGIVVMIIFSYTYVYLNSEPVSPEILEEIRRNNPEDSNELEKNRMQILFMKERGWNFIVFGCLVLAIGIWIIISAQRKKRTTFMSYKYRIEDKFSRSVSEILNLQDRLKEQFGALTSNDLLIAEMLFDGLTTKEIASELNISPASANTARYRLRKKLNIAPEEDLVDYLKNF